MTELGAVVGIAECGKGSATILRFAHAAMATTFEVRCVHQDPEYARQARPPPSASRTGSSSS
jgi:hypothetical protein